MSGFDESSSSNSDSESQSDSAYVASRAFDDLRHNRIHPRVEQWYNNNEASIQERLLANQGRNREAEERKPRYIPQQARSDTSSMAVSIASRTTYGSLASSRAPSMVNSSSTRRSISSADTNCASSILGPTRELLEEDDDGVAQIPSARSRVTWQCHFGFLNCALVFEDVLQWDTHCQSHFRGYLPRSVNCPFQGCEWSATTESGQDSWGQRWAHIFHQHRYGGNVDSRPTRSLIKHLWRHQVISDVQEQQLRQTGMLSTAGAYMLSNNSTRDRRREQRPQRDRALLGGGSGTNPIGNR